MTALKANLRIKERNEKFWFLKACEAIALATFRLLKSDHSFLRHIVPFCQKKDELTRERVAGRTTRHGTK